MEPKKLYRTVEAIASKSFTSNTEMLISVIRELIENYTINLTGGRVWELDSETGVYKLLFQTGKVDRIDDDFSIKISEYPIFGTISKERTVVEKETDMILRSKGIFKYSASGVGDKIRYDGKLYYEYLLALNSNEINEEFKITLNIIATALTSKIKQGKYHLRARELRADIDKARELQKSILPEHEYNFHNYELFGITDPAEIVGGDFFDYLDVGGDSQRLGVTVGDAASKGVSAAAEAMYISGALRMACNFEIKIYPLMKRMNQLVNKIFADDKFASLFYGELSNDKSGLFLYANAGHNPPLFIRKDSDQIILLNSTGPVLGPAPQAVYTVENINFAIGDVLVIFSDGVTESANSEFEQYGDDRLQEILIKSKMKTSKEIAYTILEDVIKFSRNGQYSDDKTLVVIKRVK
ncbi:MAG: PP2C family protein-serine/threonine phosphatase [Ignavibacteriaceae bacterium]|nr:PP2C family protein-serine/threonine phosphatase [Ignavibacteriaceae bacterium]